MRHCRTPAGVSQAATRRLYAEFIDEPDEQLLKAARAGDEAALERLLTAQHPRLYAVCLRITASHADAADAAQEALIKIVRGLPQFDGRSRFTTWCYRIATNAALDELRRRKRRPEPGELTEADLARGGPMPTDGPGGADLEGVADRVDAQQALRRLPVDYRAAVVLRDLCGLDYSEIAEVLDIPAGTVRSRISRGRAALVPLLAAQGNPAAPGGRPRADS